MISPGVVATVSNRERIGEQSELRDCQDSRPKEHRLGRIRNRAFRVTANLDEVENVGSDHNATIFCRPLDRVAIGVFYLLPPAFSPYGESFRFPGCDYVLPVRFRR